MTIHSDLVPLLTADIETALSLTAGDAYYGRRARKTPNVGALEVWVERRETTPEDADIGRASVYRYGLNVRRNMNQGSAQTGNEQDTSVEAATRTLIDRYDGAGVDIFIGGVADLVAMQAADETADDFAGVVGEDLSTVQQATVVVEFLVRR